MRLIILQFKMLIAPPEDRRSIHNNKTGSNWNKEGTTSIAEEGALVEWMHERSTRMAKHILTP